MLPLRFVVPPLLLTTARYVNGRPPTIYIPLVCPFPFAAATLGTCNFYRWPILRVLNLDPFSVSLVVPSCPPPPHTHTSLSFSGSSLTGQAPRNYRQPSTALLYWYPYLWERQERRSALSGWRGTKRGEPCSAIVVYTGDSLILARTITAAAYNPSSCTRYKREK